MCIGVPGQIRTIDGNQAKVDVCGIQRDVDLTLVGSCDENGQPRVGQWVLVHVGFAMSVINEAEARDTLDALQTCLTLSRMSARCCMARKIMRFVDEYRAPEQVMQLIEHLRERASHLSYTAERPLRIMEVCGGHTHAILNSASTSYCLKTLSLSTVRVARCAYCRWVESTPAWRLPAIRKSSSVPLATPCAYQGNRDRCCRQKHAVPMCASFTRRWMR